MSNNKEESPSLSETTTLYVFDSKDINRVHELKRKIITSPLTFLLTTSALAYLGKRFNIRRILANPLKDESEIVKNDKYWKYATYNMIIMGTLSYGIMSFFRSETNKIALYKKYEK